MQGVEKILRVRLEPDVSPVQRLLVLRILRIERVFPVGAQGIALKEERMRRIPDDVVVRILAALGHDALRPQGAFLVPQTEIGGDVTGIADFLQGQHVGPEGIDEPLPVLFQHPAQGKPRIEQEFLTLGLRASPVGFGILVVTEHITGHGLDIEAGPPIHVRKPLQHLLKPLLRHIRIDHPDAARRTGQRQQRLVLMALEHAVQILHHHGITRVVMPFLLGKHQIQRFRRFDRHLAFDRSDSAHSFLHPHTDCPPRAAGLRDGAPSRAFRACGDRPHQHAKGGRTLAGRFRPGGTRFIQNCYLKCQKKNIYPV